MTKTKPVELVACRDERMVYLRMSGNPMKTVLIDREEARALIAELQAWLDGQHPADCLCHDCIR